MNDELVNQLEIWGFEEGIALFRDKSLGFGFSLMPHDISCASDDSINQVKAQLKTFLASLPSDIDIQFIQSIDRGDASEIEEHVTEATPAPSIVSTLANDRVERFKALQADGDLTKRELLLFVRIPFKAELTLTTRMIRVIRPTEEQESIERLNLALAKFLWHSAFRNYFHFCGHEFWSRLKLRRIRFLSCNLGLNSKTPLCASMPKFYSTFLVYYSPISNEALSRSKGQFG